MGKTLLVGENLAKLVYRAFKARRMPYNYLAAARDVSGKIYIQLANAEWVGSGLYLNPHTRS